jgi:hypothetical protein
MAWLILFRIAICQSIRGIASATASTSSLAYIIKENNAFQLAARRVREEEVALTSAHPSPHWEIAVPTLVSAYQTCGHPPVAGNHAFVIIRPPTGVGTSAHAIRGSILTLNGVEGVGFCR